MTQIEIHEKRMHSPLASLKVYLSPVQFHELQDLIKVSQIVATAAMLSAAGSASRDSKG